MKKSKSITKKPTARKRPKSVLRKAWETRRAKKAKSQGGFMMEPELQEEIASLAEAAKNSLRSQALASLAQNTPTSETETPRSEDIARRAGIVEGRADLKRETDETALCGMVAMYRLWDRTNVKPAHAPYMISGITAKAIVEKLESLGYTANGKMTNEAKQWQVIVQEAATR